METIKFCIYAASLVVFNSFFKALSLLILFPHISLFNPENQAKTINFNSFTLAKFFNLFSHPHTYSIKHYNDIWKDLRMLSSSWYRVLMPMRNHFDMGVSEAIYSSVNREIIHERPSPIIYMRAQKNQVERDGMRRANIRDAVALCDTFSYLEERVSHFHYAN